MDGIFFPGLGIDLSNIPRGFTVFGFTIKFYGLIIATGFILALLIALREARRSGQNEENYLDFLLIMVIPAILGARIYYVLFDLGSYVEPGKSIGKTILDMINIRNGGLAIYGGLIAGLLTAVIFTKKRHLSLPLFADTVTMGVLVGQIMGRWGNFFNREAFGGYTNSVFRMAVPLKYYVAHGSLPYYISTNVITEKMINNMEIVHGMECITVHPTFIYESLWNLLILIFIFCYRKHKKFDGELAMIYVSCYGFGRFFIESLRSDSLMVGAFKVSQLFGLICFAVAAIVIIMNRMKIIKGKTLELHLVDGMNSEINKPAEDEEKSSEKGKIEIETQDKSDDGTETKSDDDTEDKE